MYIKKTYGYVIFEDQSFLLQKGKLDSFDPVTVHSTNYRKWVSIKDSRRCLACRDMEGKVYRIGEIEFPSPPLHTKCRCQIIPMEAIVAGNATKDGENGADFWLKHFDVLPDYYITKEGLEKLGWKDGESPSKYAPGKMLAKVKFTIIVMDTCLNHQAGSGMRQISTTLPEGETVTGFYGQTMD